MGELDYGAAQIMKWFSRVHKLHCNYSLILWISEGKDNSNLIRQVGGQKKRRGFRFVGQAFTATTLMLISNIDIL